MSSATKATSASSNTRGVNTSFGTNSPPLEATGSEKPMGMSSVHGSHNAGHVSDKEQRKDYFPDRKTSKKFEGAKETESASELK
ncbi:hypothetical protein D9619_008124 [Psilocybe cf. subviscida]|uniref:Uncharacterized protein n=1 Tax=Psilocybe cf. subviscida TaxID=2480587 RepID=A0A8H5EST0_9AGAR|nr:hypothetical protein D9619_008124 [Psilocybe cf. subviscida]